MADDLSMALRELLRKAELERDADFLRGHDKPGAVDEAGPRCVAIVARSGCGRARDLPPVVSLGAQR